MPAKQKKPVVPPPNPEPGETWRHTNGNKYEIIAIANDPPILPAHPLSVIYRGGNGKYWCRPLSDWHRSFLIDEKVMTFEDYKTLGPDRAIIPEFELKIIEEKVNCRNSR